MEQPAVPPSPSPSPPPSLSPSRAADFKSCPLLFRLRSIDRLPETPRADALRGTVVHKVLEDLFDLPATHRTPEQAHAMLPRAWEAVLESEPRAALLFGDEGPSIAEWLSSCRDSLAAYFALEDPRRLEPAEREVAVEAVLEEGLLLRGYVDRIDEAPDGALRLVDYKSGHSPAPGSEARALFQLRFYALVLWRSRGVVPRVLQLLYLGDGQVVRYEPDEDDLAATERVVLALWRAIEEARETGDFQASPGFVCRWCSFKPLCPAYGGTPPPFPEPVLPEPATPTSAPG